MTGQILITRPEHDYATRYLSVWAGKTFEIAKTKGYSIDDILKQS